MRSCPKDEPVKRWFFLLNILKAYEYTDVTHVLEQVKDGIAIEVNERDLPYLEKPEGEWVFRKVGAGDEYMHPAFKHLWKAEHEVNPARMGGYRWVKVQS